MDTGGPATSPCTNENGNIFLVNIFYKIVIYLFHEDRGTISKVEMEALRKLLPSREAIQNAAWRQGSGKGKGAGC